MSFLNPLAQSVPVLMYHHVCDNSDSFITVGSANFERQMGYLAKNGWHTLTPDELLQFLNQKQELPKKSLLITFDDGWLDNFLVAFPILQKYGLKATIFVVTSYIEAASAAKRSLEPEKFSHREAKKLVLTEPHKVAMNWDDLEQMQRSGLVAVESHTHTHATLGMHTHEEFLHSQELIKSRLGHDSKHLCFPKGEYDINSIELAKKCGYEACYTTKRGANLAGECPFEIKRFAVKDRAGFWFKKSLAIYSNAFLATLNAKQR